MVGYGGYMHVSQRNTFTAKSSFVLYLLQSILIAGKCIFKLIVIGYLFCAPGLHAKSVAQIERLRTIEKMFKHDQPLISDLTIQLEHITAYLQNKNQELNRKEDVIHDSRASQRILNAVVDFINGIPGIAHLIVLTGWKKIHSNDYFVAPYSYQERLRTILRTMGVKKTSSYFLNIQSQYTFLPFAFTVPWHNSKNIYMSQIELDINSPESQSFVLGHECSHLLYDTPLKDFMVSLGIYGAFTVVCNQIKKHIAFFKDNPRNISFWLKAWAEESVKIFSTFMLNPLYQCHREKQADLNSVKALGCARGGIIHFAMQYLLFGENAADFDHPSLLNRVKYLYEWESKHCTKHAHK